MMSTYHIRPKAGLDYRKISIRVGFANAGHFVAIVEVDGLTVAQSQLGSGLATVGDVARLIAPWAILSERQKKALRRDRSVWERARQKILRPDISAKGAYQFGSGYVEFF